MISSEQIAEIINTTLVIPPPVPVQVVDVPAKEIPIPPQITEPQTGIYKKSRIGGKPIAVYLPDYQVVVVFSDIINRLIHLRVIHRPATIEWLRNLIKGVLNHEFQHQMQHAIACCAYGDEEGLQLIKELMAIPDYINNPLEVDARRAEKEGRDMQAAEEAVIKAIEMRRAG